VVRRLSPLGNLTMKHCKLTRRRFAIDDKKKCENVEMAVGGVDGGLNIAVGSRCLAAKLR
jgi:hypothetical protein